MSENAAISVKNVKIKYRYLKKVSLIKMLFSRKKNSRSEIFEALKGISFEIPKGHILGVVGKNGSGKSTLLRVIAGIFSADEGEIDLHGNTVSLLSIGVGFNPVLTGRENIFLSAMLLGFSEAEIEEKLDEIIEFSELSEFIDRPVKTYSNGMYSKLAFSITAILETDIILIDEILSVGDANFKEKSYQKIKSLITEKDRTAIVVSHNPETLTNICNSVLWLHAGMIKMIGTAEEVLPIYNDFMSRA